MSISVRITSTGKDISALLDAALSPKAQSAVLAAFAKEKLAEAEQINRRALGRVPEHTTVVDGRREALVESVKPDGVIVYEFELLTELFVWIADQLETHSPRRTGAYAASHVFYADGVEADPRNPPAADEWVFVSNLPYSRAIERGHSRQAPNGVYEVVASLAQRRFGNQARISFTYRAPVGFSAMPVRGRARRQAAKDARQPAVVIRAR